MADRTIERVEWTPPPPKARGGRPGKSKYGFHLLKPGQVHDVPVEDIKDARGELQSCRQLAYYWGKKLGMEFRVELQEQNTKLRIWCLKTRGKGTTHDSLKTAVQKTKKTKTKRTTHTRKAKANATGKR